MDRCVFRRVATRNTLFIFSRTVPATRCSRAGSSSHPPARSRRCRRNRPSPSAPTAAAPTAHHGPGGQTRTPKTKQFYKVDIGSIPAYDLTKANAGKALYETICSGCHKTLGKSEVKGESASEIKKKIAENEGGMGPLKVLTDAQIQAIANALAQ